MIVKLASALGIGEPPGAERLLRSRHSTRPADAERLAFRLSSAIYAAWAIVDVLGLLRPPRIRPCTRKSEPYRPGSACSRRTPDAPRDIHRAPAPAPPSSACAWSGGRSRSAPSDALQPARCRIQTGPAERISPLSPCRTARPDGGGAFPALPADRTARGSGLRAFSGGWIDASMARHGALRSSVASPRGLLRVRIQDATRQV